jgi:hypothetical protein
MKISWHKTGARTGNTLIVVLALCLAAVIAALFAFRSRPVTPPANTPPAEPASPAIIKLSDATLEVIKSIGKPLDFRFYSVIDRPGVSEELQEFAARVEDTLNLYVQAAGGRIKVQTIKQATPEVQQAARAEGLRPFNIDQQEASYLGLVVARGDLKSVVPLFSLEWEQALEPDITRAIVNLPKAVDVALPARVQAEQQAAVEQVKQALPNLGTLSLDEGKKVLRESATREFEQAAKEMQEAMRAADAKVAQATSDADKAAAVENLKAVRSLQMDKLQEITLRMQAQLKALEQLKR